MHKIECGGLNCHATNVSSMPTHNRTPPFPFHGKKQAMSPVYRSVISTYQLYRDHRPPHFHQHQTATRTTPGCKQFDFAPVPRVAIPFSSPPSIRVASSPASLNLPAVLTAGFSPAADEDEGGPEKAIPLMQLCSASHHTQQTHRRSIFGCIIGGRPSTLLSGADWTLSTWRQGACRARRSGSPAGSE